MAIPTDRRRKDTRDRMVEIALSIFASHGYAGTTVSEIEAAVGLKPGSGAMYRHFESKEALLLAAVQAYHDRLRSVCDQLRSLEPAPDAQTELTRLVGALGLFLGAEHPMVMIGLDSAGLPESVRKAIGDTWEEGYRLFAEAFARYRFSDQDAQVMAVDSLGSLNNYLVQAMSWRAIPNNVTLDQFVTWWVAHWSAILQHNVA
jgi:AcrR family transcriptional regulator